ncbi:unnamed protein product [Acanthoscelides obtectus]|uniref:Uncharacterized protein n=1 Tax=Acanthoscelides obtectus TaxID=200917 RepID=A0A9P0M8H5_ACAOB|nr:unnamed protein product [Acanthoscelides obtectus]CAK1624240.1 hypothetical protein AOBTE_LOCUS2433 [Acanthoscelides obtectus]
MIDEFPADPIISFYGTGAKAYYIRSFKSETKKAKGVKKAVVQKQLPSDDYKKIIEGGWRILRKTHTFKSKLHDVYTEVKNKVALAHHDDKRFIIPNTTKTLPWGHSDIEFYQTDTSLNKKYATDAINDVAEGVFPVKW